MHLPEEFQKRMRSVLGEDYSFFEKTMDEKAIKAIYAGPKNSPEHLAAVSSIPEGTVGFTDRGFFISNESIGSEPLHHAGAFYVQDPSAMAAVCAASIRPGMRILDACAAPGGKTVQLSTLAGPDGLVVSNDIDYQRARILSSNAERMGLVNTIVTSCDPKTLKDSFDSFFDVVLCDAPCSGEGMFRKYPQAIENWSPSNVKMCAARSGEIISEVSKTLRSGGLLIYSTCTFSKEENEDVIYEFLQNNRAFEEEPVALSVERCTVRSLGLRYARRFYPHIYPGEGQFISLLRKAPDGEEPRVAAENRRAKMTKEERQTVMSFISGYTSLPDIEISKMKDDFYYLPCDFPLLPSTLSYGVRLGSIQKGRFVPAHYLFSAYGNRFDSKIELHAGDDLTVRYLRGESFMTDKENTFSAVMIDGYSLGGCKISGHMLKNYYPKGLRMN